ncbi:MAG: hypothetical protein AB7I19_11775 [Planctomycetota bacterium]
MLVARGNARYLGQSVPFTFAFGARGEVRLDIGGEPGLVCIFDGQVHRVDFGGGWSRFDGIGGHATRAWGLAVSGLWTKPLPEVATRILDRSTTSVTIEVRLDECPAVHHIRCDANSALPTGFDHGAHIPAEKDAINVVREYRAVGAYRLPFELESDDGNRYEVEEWVELDFDPELFRTSAAPRFRFAADGEAFSSRRIKDWIVARGRVGELDGWVAITPLQQTGWIRKQMTDGAVVGPDRRIEVRDLQFGAVVGTHARLVPADLPILRGEPILAVVGTDELEGCCVRVRFPGFEVEVLPPDSLGGDDLWPMSGLRFHRVFSGRLPDGTPTWWAPMAKTPAAVLVKSFARDSVAAQPHTKSNDKNEPLELDFLDAAGARLTPVRTIVLPDEESTDPTPLAIGDAALAGMTLEMDFPRGRYRLIRNR